MTDIDREKVIEILSRHKTMTFGDKLYDGIQFDLGDVVALLKEQEEQIQELQRKLKIYMELASELD